MDVLSCRCVHDDAEQCHKRTNPFRRLLITDPGDEVEEYIAYSYCHCPCHCREAGPFVFVHTGGQYWRRSAGGTLSRVGREDLPDVVALFAAPREIAR